MEPNQITPGNGNDSVVVGEGNANHVVMGDGNDSVTVGRGDSNVTNLGLRTDVVSLERSQISLTGAGHDTVYLGCGTNNNFIGTPGKSSICHLPTPAP